MIVVLSLEDVDGEEEEDETIVESSERRAWMSDSGMPFDRRKLVFWDTGAD